MTSTELDEDQFRMLAYLRGYADGWGRRFSLDPGWVKQQLEFSLPQLRQSARRLAELGLVEFFEWDPPGWLSRFEPGPIACNIFVTEKGWNYFRR